MYVMWWETGGGHQSYGGAGIAAAGERENKYILEQWVGGTFQKNWKIPFAYNKAVLLCCIDMYCRISYPEMSEIKPFGAFFF